MIPFVELYLDPYLIFDKLNSDSRVNDIYVLFLFCIVVGHGIIKFSFYPPNC